MLGVSLVLVLVFCSNTQAQNSYVLKITKIHDGDTVTADIEMDFDVTIRNQSIRFEDFDAWEISRVRRTVEVTDVEIRLGIKARDALIEFLKDKEVKILPSKKRDPYGRVLGKLYCNGTDVNQWMREHGHERH